MFRAKALLIGVVVCSWTAWLFLATSTSHDAAVFGRWSKRLFLLIVMHSVCCRLFYRRALLPLAPAYEGVVGQDVRFLDVELEHDPRAVEERRRTRGLRIIKAGMDTRSAIARFEAVWPDTGPVVVSEELAGPPDLPPFVAISKGRF